MILNRCLPKKKKLNILLDYSSENDIVTYQIVKKFKKIGEGDEDFIVYDDLVECERVNRQDKINSYRADHDVYSVIERVAETGDTTLWQNQADGLYIDMTKLPKTTAEYDAILLKASNAYDGLPEDLKGKMSLTEFVDSFKDSDLTAYFKAKEKVKEEVATDGQQ